MSNEHTHANESIDVEPRTRRALEEPLSVVSLDGTPVESTDETVVMVVSGSGESYHVDADVGRCECPDHKHRNAECKHIRRARAALGTDPVASRTLAAVDVDSQFGTNAPGPVVATSDGGMFREAARSRQRVPVAGGVLVYEEDPDELGRRLVGFEDVTDWSDLREALATRGHNPGAIHHKEVLDE